jgi:hypothetical protein
VLGDILGVGGSGPVKPDVGVVLMKLTEPPSANSGPEGERTYHCGTRGLALGRDHNASINLARRGQDPVLDVEGR